MRLNVRLIQTVRNRPLPVHKQFRLLCQKQHLQYTIFLDTNRHQHQHLIFRNRFNSFVGNSKHALVNRAPRNKITLNQNTDGLMKDFDDPLLSLNMHNAPSDMDGVDDSTSPSLQKDKKVTRGLICESYGNTNNHVSWFNCVVHSMLLYKSNE